MQPVRYEPLLVRAAGDCPARTDHADMPRLRSAQRRLDARVNHSRDTGTGVASASSGSAEADAVSGHHHREHVLLQQKLRDLVRKARHHLTRLAAIGDACGIGGNR